MHYAVYVRSATRLGGNATLLSAASCSGYTVQTSIFMDLCHEIVYQESGIRSRMNVQNGAISDINS